MRHLRSVLRFVGRATPVGEVGDAWRITMTAPLHAAAADELPGAFMLLPGAVATIGSEVIFTAEQSFLAFGVLRIGDRDRLRLATVGCGYLGPSADPNVQEGAAIWRVENGEGQLAGATGLIASAFLVDEELGVVDHQVAVLLLP